MASFKVIEPFPPFDYGSEVIWLCDNGTLLEGSIFAFQVIEDQQAAELLGVVIGTLMASIELPSGDTREVPLLKLTLI